MLNEIVLVGYLGADPRLDERVKAKGKNKAYFPLSLYRSGGKNGNFIFCEGWEKTAEIMMNFGKKGMKTTVHGELRVDVWGDKNENSRTYIHIKRVLFDLPKRESSASTGAPVSEPYKMPSPSEAIVPTTDPFTVSNDDKLFDDNDLDKMLQDFGN